MLKVGSRATLHTFLADILPLPQNDDTLSLVHFSHSISNFVQGFLVAKEIHTFIIPKQWKCDTTNNTTSVWTQFFWNGLALFTCCTYQLQYMGKRISCQLLYVGRRTGIINLSLVDGNMQTTLSCNGHFVVTEFSSMELWRLSQGPDVWSHILAPDVFLLLTR